MKTKQKIDFSVFIDSAHEATLEIVRKKSDDFKNNYALYESVFLRLLISLFGSEYMQYYDDKFKEFEKTMEEVNK